MKKRKGPFAYFDDVPIGLTGYSFGWGRTSAHSDLLQSWQTDERVTVVACDTPVYHFSWSGIEAPLPNMRTVRQVRR